MGANPHANGGLLLRDLRLPDYREYAVSVPTPGAVDAEATRVQGDLHPRRDEEKRGAREFPRIRPGRNGIEPLGRAVRRHRPHARSREILPSDDHVAPDGRAMEVLSEHLCQGWLEGYLLTGRHGFFSCYEAFIHIVDSMFNQHAKWLKVSREHPVAPADRLAQLPALLARVASGPQRIQHQDPGFIDHVVNKKAEIMRVYLPPDANMLAAGDGQCLRSRQLRQCHRRRQAAGAAMARDGRGHRAIVPPESASGSGPADEGGEPDVVMACCGDVPTLETLAAVSLLREHLPELKMRVVNVVDLMKLQPASEHPHGLSDEAFDALFTRDRPIIFAFHGYPWLIHRLTYRRTNHDKSTSAGTRRKARPRRHST